MTLLSQIESILFVASKPLTLASIAKAVGKNMHEVEEAIENLKLKYNAAESGIHIFGDGNTIRMGTHPENESAIDKFVKDEVAGELTKAQLETLTVIAYRGPITRPELEQIRGVNCSVILRNLMIRGLVEQIEDSSALLPPYVLTVTALSHLGVASVTDLPDYDVLHTHEHLDQKLEEID